jgi:hypothetical protein
MIFSKISVGLATAEPFPGTPYFELRANDYDFYGDEPAQIVLVENERMPKEILFVPGLLMIMLIYLLQLRRREDTPAAAPA